MLTPFFIWQERELIKVHPENVIFLETEKNYTKIFFVDESFYMVRSTLESTIKKLPQEMFIRVHRSFIVSVFHITRITRSDIIINNFSVPIGRLYYKGLMERLNVID